MTQLQAKHLKDYQSPVFTITDIDLDFILDAENTKVTAISQVKRLKSSTKLVLDGDKLSLHSVLIDGKVAKYQQTDTQLIVETGELTDFSLTVVTLLDPEANSSLEGLYMSDGAYCTQCEAEGFRRITYFLDRPDVLAKYQVRVEADKTTFPFLLSNGNKVDQGDMPRSGRHFVKWQDPFPKPSYLFALVAGDFDVLDDTFVTKSNRSVSLQVFVDKGNLHKADHAMASLKKSMKWDEDRFGLEYDLDIYMIVAVDFFNMGAMENKGLNVFNTKYVLADKASATDDDYHGIESVVGHEYFHNWTGNRVTCRDWFQLSLKEGLTVFRDQEFSSDVGSRAVNRINAIKVLKNQQFAEDSGPMAHPIRPESVIEMNNFYTVTVYDKGAEVIRMMHSIVGEAGFQAGMRCYFERHDGQAVTCDDFVDAMSSASGKDLTQFKRWYSQAGTPELTVSEQFNAQDNRYELTVKQQVIAQGKRGAPLHIPFSLELLDAEGNSIYNNILDVTQSEQTFSFSDVQSKPIASLLQDFSAPVKLSFEFTTDHLIHLMRFATSEVARWEASVQLVSHAIWKNVEHLQNNSTMRVDPRVVDAFKGMILNPELDKALLAEVLTIPSMSALIEQVDIVDLDNLLHARAFVIEHVATECEDELLARYRELSSQDSSAARAMKNACLGLLALTSDDVDGLIEAQYQQATNMTDALGALKAAVNAKSQCMQTLLAQFETRWQDTPLVMDKWFTLQASINDDNVIDNITALTNHNSFSFTNPNRVRSLIGMFAANNIAQFHKADGSGYQYLTKILVKMNETNPQVAARMITSLIQFGKFDPARQALMKQQLVKLQSLPNLSKDLFEKVNKALEM
ncbi:aminopeptidase N [Shewanella intestini]|uniref:Aminopeptidase N n=1 Tax=Shewanella intestini TaxID=2017544 RepID=A0ABS5I1G9_9GAMM|nr:MULTISPECIES: aminopeptidase N [Shewanella]MBR9727854.1 aminopeptidase N [Shewanella intestini]MRG36153.1 aminopeptidase N [Shewanella sp. XMDDZSB0408]